MRESWVYRDGDLITRQEAWERDAASRHGTSAYVISDTMDHTMNPVDGKHYDSKSQFYRTVRRAGCEIMGNEAPTRNVPTFKPTITGHDIKRAIEQCS